PGQRDARREARDWLGCEGSSRRPMIPVAVRSSLVGWSNERGPGSLSRLPPRRWVARSRTEWVVWKTSTRSPDCRDRPSESIRPRLLTDADRSLSGPEIRPGLSSWLRRSGTLRPNSSQEAAMNAVTSTTFEVSSVKGEAGPLAEVSYKEAVEAQVGS